MVKKFKSKKFRIAKEGATTDGRKISREWIEQMAGSYDPKKYGARINLEHIRGIYPDSAFKAYGDVIKLNTEEENGTLYLTAEIDPTDDLVDMNKKRQKVYTSMEVDPEFADTGGAYLVGLAVTDSPASLGTEMLQFSATAKVNPFSDRKVRPENLFSECFETDIKLFEEGSEHDSPSLIESVRALFAKQNKNSKQDSASLQADLLQALEEFSNGIAGEYISKTAFSQAQSEYATLKENFTALKAAHDDLVVKLSNEPDTPPRPHAAGSDSGELTNC